MRQHFGAYGLAGLVTGGAIAAVLLLNPLQARSPDPAVSQAPASPEPGSRPAMGMSEQRFIEMMIPHHQGAIEMAELALTEAQHPELRELARAMIEAQNREIKQMQDWYQTWYGTEVPEGNAAMMGDGMGMHGMGMHNMTMAGDLEALRQAPDFDREFIRQMIPHHQMAVHMAEMMLPNAEHKEMQDLAQSIIDSQSTEIEQMQQWYQDWGR